MKRKITGVLAAMLLLSGCAGDTMVYIPDEPEWVMAYTESTELAEEPSATPAAVETAPEETGGVTIKVTGSAASSKKKPTTSGGSSKITTTEKPKETKPAETKPTKPVETKPVETKPPKPVETEPKETEPKPTKPAETKPVETKPAETEPPATEVPVTEPPATEPPATEPLMTEPPATEPPVTEAPVTEPPATEMPQTEPPATEPPLYDISGYVVGSLEYEILDRINEYRAEAELEELVMDEWLCAIASCRGYEVSQVWSHTRPDGRNFTTVLTDYGYSTSGAQELLVNFYGSNSGAAIVDKWMNSESHRTVLLGNRDTLGVGVYRTDGFVYVACLVVN